MRSVKKRPRENQALRGKDQKSVSQTSQSQEHQKSQKKKTPSSPTLIPEKKDAVVVDARIQKTPHPRKRNRNQCYRALFRMWPMKKTTLGGTGQRKANYSRPHHRRQPAKKNQTAKKDQTELLGEFKFSWKRGCKCFSQACCQAEAMIVSKKWLTKIELDKIKAECKDECCNPADSSASATSSAILRWINAPISEAATEHSEIRRLLNLANENSKSSEAATEHCKIPEAACPEAKRPKKSGKGSFSQTQKILYPGTNAKTTTQACKHWALLQSMSERTLSTATKHAL